MGTANLQKSNGGTTVTARKPESPIKIRLKKYKKLLDEIDLEERREKALSNDKALTNRRAIAGIRDSLLALIEQEQQEYEELIKIINALPCAEQRQLMLARYMERQPWERVTEIMFGAKNDYREKFDSYKRRTHRIHGSALANANKIAETENNSKN